LSLLIAMTIFEKYELYYIVFHDNVI